MSQLISGSQLPWQRYWQQSGSTDRVDEESGFLFLATNIFDDPAASSDLTDSGIYRTDQLAKVKFAVLHGRPGHGKSIELRTLHGLIEDCGDDSIFVDLTEVPTLEELRSETIDSDVWIAWRNGSGNLTLFLDSLDEGLFRIGRVVESLTRWLKDMPKERLSLLIACRSADLPSEASSRLAAIMGTNSDFRFELCPLRQEDVLTAASSCGIDTENFSHWLITNRLTQLAASPLTLRMLISEYQQDPSFAGSHYQLYTRFCYRLSGEWDPDRERELDRLAGETGITQEGVMELASRIAAIQLVCGKTGMFPGTSAQDCPDGALSRDDIGLHGSNDVSVALPTSKLVRATLSTPLFRVSRGDYFNFDHRTIAEALGSQFLECFSNAQLRGILFDENGSSPMVIPQLGELAAWISVRNVEFFDYLVSLDPQILLKADVSQSQADRKADLVEAILRGADTGTVFEDWGSWRNYRSLVHPGIAIQLEPYLTDTSKSIVARRIAFKIVAECRVIELSEHVWEVVERNFTEDKRVIGAIADALAVMPGADYKLRLLNLLNNPNPIDEEGDLKAAALKVLVPEIMPLRDVSEFLTRPTGRIINSDYNTWVTFEAPQHLGSDDLDLILPQLKSFSGCFESGSIFANLALKAIQLAVDHIDRPEIAALFADFWLSRIRNSSTLPSFVLRGIDSPPQSRRSFSVILRDQNHRWDLIRIVLGHSGLRESDAHFLSRDLVEAGDLPVLITEMRTATEVSKFVLADLIERFCHSPEFSQSWDPFLLELEGNPVLQEKFEWLGPSTLEEIDKRAKESRERRAEISSSLKNRIQQKGRTELLRDALDRAKCGESDSWLWISHYLCVDEIGHHRGDTILDLTSSETWPELTEEQRQIIRGSARLYLETCTPERRTHHRSVQAVYLIRDQLMADERFRVLVERDWLMTIINCNSFFKDGRGILFELIRKVSTLEFDRRLFQKVRMEADSGEWLFVLNGLESMWDRSLSENLIDLLVPLPPKTTNVRSAFEFLRKVDLEAAERFLFRMFERDHLDGFFFKPHRCVWAHMIFHFPMTHWETVWNILRKFPWEVRKMFLENDHLFGYGNQLGFDQFSERQLADLYLLLIQAFPEDPVDNRESGAVYAIDHVQFFRSNCLNVLVARGTSEACDEMLRIVNATEGDMKIWLQWLLKDAESNRMRKDWVPADPRSLLKLRAHAGMRVVNSEAALLEVVLGSLDRLQVLLHGENPAVQDFWNEPAVRRRGALGRPRSENWISTIVSRHLQSDLAQKEVVVNREVDVSTQDFADIHVTATARNRGEIQVLKVVIEVKGCWHDELETAMETQLKRQYLHSSASRHGIYLIAWFPQEQWDHQDSRRDRARRRCSDFSQTRARFESQSANLSDGLIKISAFTLDCQIR